MSSWCRSSRQHLEIVRVVHDAQDVAERVNRGSSHKAMASILWCLQLFCAHGYDVLEHLLQVIDVPIDHHPGGADGKRYVRCVFAVNNPHFGSIITDPKLGVPWPREVGLNSENLAVPLNRCRMIGGPQTDGCDSSWYRCHTYLLWITPLGPPDAGRAAPALRRAPRHRGPRHGRSRGDRRRDRQP